MIWFVRNEVAHGKEGLGVQEAVFLTKDKTLRYLSPSFKFTVIGNDGVTIWEPPEGTTVKINCDGA